MKQGLCPMPLFRKCSTPKCTEDMCGIHHVWQVVNALTSDALGEESSACPQIVQWLSLFFLYHHSNIKNTRIKFLPSENSQISGKTFYSSLSVRNSLLVLIYEGAPFLRGEVKKSFLEKKHLSLIWCSLT